jgi:hypothetical protein
LKGLPPCEIFCLSVDSSVAAALKQCLECAGVACTLRMMENIWVLPPPPTKTLLVWSDEIRQTDERVWLHKLQRDLLSGLPRALFFLVIGPSGANTTNSFLDYLLLNGAVRLEACSCLARYLSTTTEEFFPNPVPFDHRLASSIRSSLGSDHGGYRQFVEGLRAIIPWLAAECLNARLLRTTNE